MDESMVIINDLLALKHDIADAKRWFAENEKLEEEFRCQRIDARHDLVNIREDDKTTTQLLCERLEAASKYVEIDRQYRQLKTENSALAHFIGNDELHRMVEETLELMTGQLQFLEHYIYHRRFMDDGDGGDDCE